MFASSAEFPCTSYRASFRSLLHRLLAGTAVTNNVEVFAAPLGGLFRLVDRLDVGDAAQRQRQRAALARAGEHFGLIGLQLERNRPADQGAAAFFFLRRLVDRENANIAEDDFRDGDVSALAVGVL